MADTSGWIPCLLGHIPLRKSGVFKGLDFNHGQKDINVPKF